MKRKTIFLCLVVLSSCNNHYLNSETGCLCNKNAQAQIEFNKLIEKFDFFISTGIADEKVIYGIRNLEQVTSIQSEFPLTHFGKLPTKSDIKKWKKWFKNNKDCLDWNELNKKLSICKK